MGGGAFNAYSEAESMFAVALADLKEDLAGELRRRVEAVRAEKAAVEARAAAGGDRKQPARAALVAAAAAIRAPSLRQGLLPPVSHPSLPAATHLSLLDFFFFFPTPHCIFLKPEMGWW